jgi:TPR repeat protein
VNDESQLQIRPKDSDSALSLSKGASSLVARGRVEALALTSLAEPESEECRHGLLRFDFETPYNELIQLAERGDAVAQFGVAGYCWAWSLRASMTEERTSLHADAVSWFRQAAEQGYPAAQFELGWFYDNEYLGVPGVGQDYGEAAKWYRKSADQDYAPAQFHLGVMFDRGEGVPQSYSQAAEWYRKAADQGVADGQLNLGVKYEKGEGVPRDYAEAVYLYRKAADQGNAKARCNLALKYYSGIGVSQDYVQAHMWMSLAAPYGNEDDKKRYLGLRDRIVAKMSQGQVYESQNLVAGHFRRAAEDGDFIAQMNLGVLHESGLGVLQDYVKAYMWMSLAISTFPDYAGMRDRLSRAMSSEQLVQAQQLEREWKDNRVAKVMAELKRSLEARKNRPDSHPGSQKGWTPV